MNSTGNSVDFSKLSGQNQPIPFESEDLGISSRQFRILFDNLTSGISLCKMVYDAVGAPTDFVTLEANPSFAAAFSTKREKLIQRRASGCEPFKKCFVELMRIYGVAAVTGKPQQCEVYFQAQDKWYQIYAYTPKEGYVISMFMDLTERKKAEQQLLASEKRYRRLYETTLDGINARDLKGRMIDCNQAYAKMLGYTKKELRNLTVQQLLPDKWHEQRERVVSKVLQTGRSIVFEREYRRKDGSVFPASVRTWRLTDGKGKVIGIWSIVRDISEQKAHQKSLEKQAETLERVVEERTKQLKESERLAAIGQTAGMVGHDLRNPLQTVIGELYLAKSEVGSLPENDVKRNLRESIEVVEVQTAYMDKIVSDLQAFVRPIRINKNPLVLKETLNDVLTSIAIPANITMQMQVEDHCLQLKADQQLLKRVLINLVTNSVQAMPNGGKLTLKSQVNRDGQVSITVEDTGVGIPEKIKPQIFTPLFTTKPRGQGFGLAVCKRVIEAHGGTISFESEEGKGAKFTIQLPLG
jgi:two-component system sensor kinase FixL